MTIPYPGTDTATEPLVSAWWTRAWTAQNKAYLLAPTTGSPPGAPTVTMVNVVHSYFDWDGTPDVGFLTFMPTASATLTQGSTTWRLPARLAGTATQGPYSTGYGWHQESAGAIYLYQGQLYVSLMATDTPGLVVDNNNPLTYLVVEHFDGGRVFQISVPGASSNPVDLDSLMIKSTLQPYSFDPTNVLAMEHSEFVGLPENVIDGGGAFAGLVQPPLDGGTA